MIMTLEDLIDVIIERGGSLGKYVIIQKSEDKNTDYFPVKIEVEDDEIRIIIDC